MKPDNYAITVPLTDPLWDEPTGTPWSIRRSRKWFELWATVPAVHPISTNPRAEGMLGIMVRAIEVRMSGEVQGVSFRAFAAREAVRFELVGWVRNELEGSVLAHFEGQADDVGEMLAWCREGSPSADVHRVEVRDVEPIGASDFSVEH